MNYSHFRTVTRPHGTAVVSFNRQDREYRIQCLDKHNRLVNEDYTTTSGEAMESAGSMLEALQRMHERMTRPGVDWQSLSI